MLELLTVQAGAAKTLLVPKLDFNSISLSSLERKTSKTIHDGKDVEVISEPRESDKDWKLKLLQLGRYAMSLLLSQLVALFTDLLSSDLPWRFGYLTAPVLTAQDSSISTRNLRNSSGLLQGI
jgi:hypothetical protein